VGQQNASVTVKVNGDATFESDETVTATFSGSDLVASVTASGTISNDDTDPDTVAQTKTLTAGNNTITTGSGDDTFDASTSGTLDSIDTLDGGTGSDTLEATMGGESIRPTISGIETISITSNTAANTLDTRSITGATIYNSESSDNDLTLNYLSAVPAVNLNSDSGATTINFTDAALVGTTDNLALGVNNHTGAVTITDGGGTTNELETLTINSTSLASTIATLTTSGVETTSLVVTGDANLVISNAQTATSITSSAFTGNLTVTGSATVATTITTGAGNDTITTGAGNDIVTSGAGNDSITLAAGTDNITAGEGTDTISIATAGLTKADTIAGGDGTDTIKYTGDETAADVDFTLVTGVETITSAADKDLDITLGNFAAAAGITTVTLAGAAALDTDTIAIDADGPSVLTVNFDDDANAANSVVAAALYAGAITVNADGDELDSQAHTITGGTGSDTLNIKADASTIEDADMANVSKVDTINITGTTVAQSLELHDANATYTSATVYDTLTISASGLTTGAATIDASAESDGKIVITGGGGADIITLSASANFGDTIDAGAGNDKIYADSSGVLTATDTVGGGDGTDTLYFNTDSTVTDAQFTGLTGVEAVTSIADIQLNVTLGDVAATAGITTVTLAGTQAADADTVAIDSDGPSAITVNLDSDAAVKNSVIANAAYTGTLTVKADGDELDTTASTITGGAGTSDVLSITADATAGGADQLGLVTNIETFKITGTTVAGGLTLDDANATFTSSSNYQTITVDASALTTGVATINASAEADAKVVIKGGGGADIITASTSSNLGDTISGNGGNDIINIASASFSSADTIDGGAGTDVISLSSDATVVDADFTLVTNVETLTTTGDVQMVKATLGALAMAAGITKVILADTTAADTVVIGADFTNDITVALRSDAGAGAVVTATTHTGVLTVTAADSDLDSAASTITGGTGTADHIKITPAGADLTVVLVSGVTGIEKISTVGTAGGISFTTADAMIASGKNLAVDLTSGDDDANTVNAAAEKDGTVTITADATGDHIITLGQGNDTYTHTGTTGDSTVVATKGNNIITTGGGADTITLGTGIDTVTGGAGNDTIKGTGPTISALLVTTAGNFTSADIIAGGTGTDILEITTEDVQLIDTDFGGLTSIETLTTSAGVTMKSVTLGAKAMAAGIATVTMADTAESDKVVVSAAFTSALAVNLSADAAANTVDGSASAATLTITAGVNELDTTANVLKGGTGTSDTLKITVNGNAIVAADTANWSGIENYTTVGNAGAQGLTLSDGNIAAGKTLTINAESMTSTAFTLVGSAETDGAMTVKLKGSGSHDITLGQGNDTISVHDVTSGNITAVLTNGNNTVTTSSGDDIVTFGMGIDIVSTGSGADIITVASGALDQNDTLTAGAGADILKVSSDATIRDSDFTNVTGLETLTTSTTAVNLTATLGAKAAAAGITTVTLTDAGAANTLTVGAGFTTALAIAVSSDAAAGDVIDLTGYTKAATITMSSANADDNASTITGGSGTDTLSLTSAAADTIILTGVTAVEKYTMTGTGGDTTLTTDAGNVAAGASLTVDSTSFTSQNLTTDFSALVATASVTILSDGTGTHTAILGQGNDTYTSTSSGVDTVTGTKGNNIITTGDGIDVVTFGSGTDTINLTAAADGSDADVYNLSAVAQLVADTAVITGWHTTQIINITLAALNDGVHTAVSLEDGRVALAAGDAVVKTLTTNGTFVGQTDNTSLLILDGTKKVTTSDQLETALEFGGDYGLIAGAALFAGDRFLVAYDNDVDSYIAMVTVNSPSTIGSYFGAGSLTATTLIKLVAVTDAGGIAASDIVIV
jgi:hypothetical protein